MAKPARIATVPSSMRKNARASIQLEPNLNLDQLTGLALVPSRWGQLENSLLRAGRRFARSHALHRQQLHIRARPLTPVVSWPPARPQQFHFLPSFLLHGDRRRRLLLLLILLRFLRFSQCSPSVSRSAGWLAAWPPPPGPGRHPRQRLLPHWLACGDTILMLNRHPLNGHNRATTKDLLVAGRVQFPCLTAARQPTGASYVPKLAGQLIYLISGRLYLCARASRNAARALVLLFYWAPDSRVSTSIKLCLFLSNLIIIITGGIIIGSLQRQIGAPGACEPFLR